MFIGDPPLFKSEGDLTGGDCDEDFPTAFCTLDIET